MGGTESSAAPVGAPLAQIPSWVWDPAARVRARGFSTATLLVYPMLLRIQPRNLPVSLGRAPAAEYAWPSLVVQQFVWSYHVRLPGLTTVLLDLAGELSSAYIPFRMRKRVIPLLQQAGFDVVEDVVRGWETPRPILSRDYPRLQGRLPASVLVARSWWPGKPGSAHRES
jgi:hypothetical protein